MSSLVSDARLAIRTLRKDPLYTTMVAVTLALGFGGTIAIFTVLNAVVFRSLPYPEADQLVQVQEVEKATRAPHGAAYGNFADWRDRAGSFQDLTAVAAGANVNLTAEGEAVRRWARASPTTSLTPCASDHSSVAVSCHPMISPEPLASRS